MGGLPIQRDLDDPLAAALSDVAGCRDVNEVRLVLPEPGAVDEAVDAIGGQPGVVQVNGMKLFHGTLEVAAFEFGGKALFLGREGEAWLRLAPGEAVRLRAYETTAGRQLWYVEDSASSLAC